MARILLSRADIGEVEERYVVRALRSGWVTTAGPDVAEFEAEVAACVGVAGAVALSSGTAGLHLALLGVGVGVGTVVVLPTVTFAASANAVAYTGADPVFVDCGTEDGNVDCALLIGAVHALLADGVRVSAVMTVDLFGRCVDYDRLVGELARLRVPLVEDAAEAFGAGYRGAAAGSFGAAAVLSFNGNKILTTSGGGMLLSNDLDLLARARYLAGQARQPVAHYEHCDIGFNYRMSNVLAALGRAQLTRLPDLVARRRSIRDRYAAGLAAVPGLRLLGRGHHRGDEQDNCWLTTVVLDPAVVALSAASLIKALDAADIEARHLWKPMHLQPVFADCRSFLTGAGERLFETAVSLPSGSELSDADVDRVLAAVRDALGTDPAR